LGTEEAAEFGFGFGVGCFVETRVVVVVVGGVADLDGLLFNGEGDCDRPDRNLLEEPDGEGRRGIAGIADAGLPKFVFEVVK